MSVPRGAAALAFLICVSGCSGKPADPPQPSASPATPAPSAPATGASGMGTVAGTVPTGVTAIVVLEPKDGRSFGAQTEKPVMDQVGLTFGPELLLVRTGQPAEFRNNDDTLHNINVKHDETREQAFNVAIPTGATFEYTFKRDGFYRVGCDIHPSMAAAIFSASTPFTAVADRDGRFTFTDVPAGAWTMTVFMGGKQLRRDIDVKGGVTDVTVE
jgi:plastocyanin